MTWAPPASGFVRARSSAEEHYLDMVGVTGSIPVAPTNFCNKINIFLDISVSGTYFRFAQHSRGFYHYSPEETALFALRFCASFVQEILWVGARTTRQLKSTTAFI
jgi:hypothetical protein